MSALDEGWDDAGNEEGRNNPYSYGEPEWEEYEDGYDAGRRFYLERENHE